MGWQTARQEELRILELNKSYELWDRQRPKAIIFDVDGTLCDVRPIRHLILPSHPDYPGYRDFDLFHRASWWCEAHAHVVKAVDDAHDQGLKVIIVTARRERYREVTESWLENQGIEFDEIHFRPDDDLREDTIIKREILGDLSNRFRIVAAWDDNPKIIALWKNHGIPVFEVPGWYDESEWVNPK